MKLWITKPESYEVYMGGLKRSFYVWMMQPSYSHEAREQRQFNIDMLVERGWVTPNDRASASNIRCLLEQYPQLAEVIWDRVRYAECPPDIEDYKAWTAVEENWDKLGDSPYDERWESHSRIHHKRFLLEVETDTQTVKLIKPQVFFADEDGSRHYSHREIVITDEVPQLLKRFGGSYDKKEYQKAFFETHGEQCWI